MPLRLMGSHRPSGSHFRELIRLSIPVATVQVGIMMMGVVDTVMVGRLSSADLAGIALGNVYFFATVVFGMGVLFSLDPVVSQAIGADDAPAIGRAVQRSCVIAFCLAVLGGLVLLPGEFIFSVLRQPEGISHIAAQYARATIAGVFPFYVFVAFRQTLQAMGRVKPIVIVVILANAANFLFNWVLIYGNLGFPRMGAVGSGWASSLARLCMVIAILVMAWRHLEPHLHPRRPEAFRLVPLIRTLRVGTPIGIQVLLEFGAFGVTAILMGWISEESLAGHQIALNLAATTFMLAVGVAQASAVLVGRAVGRSDMDGARRAAGAAIFLVVCVMSVSAATFLAFPGTLAHIFSTDLEVIAVAAILIPVAGVFQIFDGLQAVASGILRGAGETRAPMIVNVLGFWVIGLPISIWLGFYTSAGPVGLWWGLAIGLAVVALFLLLHIRRHFRRTIERLVID